MDPEDQPQGHPAWQEILSEVPEDLHPLLKPKLEEWDRNVQNKLQGVRSEYEGFDTYKPLIENKIPLEHVQQALYLAHQLEQNPQEIVDQAIKAFDLKYVPADQISSNNDEEEEEDYEDMSSNFDITKHPEFKAMQEQARQLQEYLDSQKQEEESQQALSNWEKELQELHSKHDIKDEQGNVVRPGFDDTFVTAFAAQGYEPEDAVKMFNDIVNERVQTLAGHTQQQQEPLVVMGGDGTTGTGIPQQPVNMGKLGKYAVDDLVQQIIDADRSA